jgi:ribosomal protein S18 acetylase RimI-like enzyme
MNALLPMNAVQFAQYLPQLAADFAQDKIQSGQWAKADALELARKSLEESLPRGLETPDHYFYVMQAGPKGDAVGVLWIAAQTRGDHRVAYVYDVLVHAAYRRQGHATWAFAALEAEVQRLGLSGIALHVFGHNTAAQALYTKLGYCTTNINMYKALAPAA